MNLTRIPFLPSPLARAAVAGGALAVGATFVVQAVRPDPVTRPDAALRAAGLSSAPGAQRTPPPPAFQPIETERDIALPAGVKLTSSQGVRLAPDGRHLIMNVVYGGTEHVGAMNIDGTGFNCVTCGKLDKARGTEVFPDGKRLWIEHIPDSSGAAGASGGIGDIHHSVLECAPSVYDCRTGKEFKVRFPIPGLKQGAQNRATQVHPDGRHVRWTEVRTFEGARMTIGTLARRRDHYAVVDPKVVNPAYTLGDDPEDWIDAGAYYEAGQWMDGGRTLKLGVTTGGALNYDMYTLDMATGRRQRLTTDIDYNEMIDQSPDDTALAYTSARGLDRMDVFTQVRRPPFIDMVAFAQIGRVGLWNNRRCMNERWLMDRAGQRGTYGGQPVVSEDDWVVRAWTWFPDGTRAVVAEEHLTKTTGTPGDKPDIRIRVLRFPVRKPSAPTPVVDLDDIDLSKSTVPYAEYKGAAARQIRDRVVRGPKGGTARLTFTGTFLAGRWEVKYDRYSEDGRSFVSGTESLSTPASVLAATWRADLKVTGRDKGYLRGDIDVRQPAKFNGTVTSELNGRVLNGVPTQATCPGVRQPALSLARAGAAGGTLDIRVTSLVPEDPTPRPVRGATVTAGGHTVRTDARGIAHLPATGAGQVTVTATAGGFKPAEAAMTVEGAGR